MIATKNLQFTRQFISIFSQNISSISTLPFRKSANLNISQSYSTATNITTEENKINVNNTDIFGSNENTIKYSTSSNASSFGSTTFGSFSIEKPEISALKTKQPVERKLTESERVRQIRRRVRLYTQMLAQQPKTVTINFTEKRTNTFCTVFSGKEPKMHLLSGYSVGQLLKVTKRARRTPQNTKIFVESIMRRRLPRIMALTNSTVINVRINGTRKVAKPLIAELRTLLQDQMKEVRETGSLSHPLWTVGSIKNITPFEMGSHKKRKRWRHL